MPSLHNIFLLVATTLAILSFGVLPVLTEGVEVSTRDAASVPVDISLGIDVKDPFANSPNVKDPYGRPFTVSTEQYINGPSIIGVPGDDSAVDTFV